MTDRDRQAAVLFDQILDVVIKASMRCPCVLQQVQEDLRERIADNIGDPFYASEERILVDMVSYLERCIAARKDSRCAS